MTATVLDSIISSRIRRTLLEHFLSHPADRFYLRGLAKALALSVSPTRRELKRLEASGLLKAYDEANIRFYVVDRTAPLFLQLTAALRTASVREPTPQAPPPPPLEVAPSVVPLHTPVAIPVRIPPSSRWSWKPAMEAAALSLTVAAVLAGVAYLAYTNQHLMLMTKKAVLAPKTHVTVVESPSTETASGAMRGHRWQLVPGGMGGVSPESY